MKTMKRLANKKNWSTERAPNLSDKPDRLSNSSTVSASSITSSKSWTSVADDNGHATDENELREHNDTCTSVPKGPYPNDQHQHQNQHAIIHEQLIQLQLENSELRARLTALDGDCDESKEELLSNLKEATRQNEALQIRINELGAGFIEIDKERRGLRQCADAANEDRLQMEKKYLSIERHLKIREKEVQTLSERVREQERRLENSTDEILELKVTIRKLEGTVMDLEHLREKVELMRTEESRLLESEGTLKKKNFALTSAIEKKVEELDEENKKVKTLAEELQQVKDLLNCIHVERDMQEKESKRIAEDLKKEIQEKNLEITVLNKELMCLTQENKTNLEKMSKKLADQLQDSHFQLNELKEALRIKCDAENALQSELRVKLTTIQSYENDTFNLRKHLEQLQCDHTKALLHLRAENKELHENKLSLEDQLLLQVEVTNQLRIELTSQSELHLEANEKLISTQQRIQAENKDLTDKLLNAKDQLSSSEDNLGQMQQRHLALEKELHSVVQLKSQAQCDIETLNRRIKMMSADHEDQLAQKMKRVSSFEKELKAEKNISNDLRAKLRELNLQSKKDHTARDEQIKGLENELENTKQKLFHQEEECHILRTNHEDQKKQHHTELESLQMEYDAQILDMEARGADVVSDLDERIAALEKEKAEIKLNHVQIVSMLQQKISQANTENEILSRQVDEMEKKTQDQEEKLRNMTALGQHRCEKIVALQKELARVQNVLDHTVREQESAMSEMSRKHEDSRLAHEQEMKDIQHVVSDIRGQLKIANERLAVEDGELDQTKSKLAERTNLLREMVAQTKSYQSDYERENARTNKLSEALNAYKSQLTEARTAIQRFEEEMDKKECQYQEAIRNERNQRSKVETKLESSLKSMESIMQKNNDMERDIASLRDKVRRQENYIGRLQDRKKTERDQRRGPLPFVTSKPDRPSTAGSYRTSGRERFRSNSPPPLSILSNANIAATGVVISHDMPQKMHQLSLSDKYIFDENKRPTTGTVLQQGVPDELDILLG